MRAMRKMREGFGLQHVVAAFTMNFYSCTCISVANTAMLMRGREREARAA
jgi:hypothetical protein